jgi:CheY-like chemotaxis protein
MSLTSSSFDLRKHPRVARGTIGFMRLELVSEGNDKSSGNVFKEEDHKAKKPSVPQILIIEDILMAAWHLEALVEELNCEVRGLAANGKEAIERANYLKPNLLLVDINLGKGMDGIETARRICETIDTAVVFITAYSDGAKSRGSSRYFPERRYWRSRLREKRCVPLSRPRTTINLSIGFQN